MKKQEIFGLAVGVITVILSAMSLNHYFGWLNSAVMLGLILGLEAGFWIGAPQLTCKIHASAFSCLADNKKPILDRACNIIVKASYVAAFCITIWTVNNLSNPNYFINWVSELVQVQMLDGVYMNKLAVISMSIFYAFAVFTPLTLFNNIYKKEIFIAPSNLVLSYIAGIFFPVVAPLIVVAIALAGVIVALIVVGAVLVTLTKIAGDKETAGITVGIIAGGITGLTYSGWTNLSIMPTIQAVLVGLVAGLVTPYLMIKVSKTKTFARVASI